MNTAEITTPNPAKKRSWFTKKKIIWTVIILLVVGPIVYNIAKGKDPAAGIQTDRVKKQDLKQTVLATGQVISSTDLNLSFKSGGIVSKVNVKEGDKARAGQVLAQLDARDQAAALTTARGSLAQARANYNRVLAGASNEDITVAQVTLDNAKSALKTSTVQQQVLVDNAYHSLINSGLTAVAGSVNSGSVTATVSGTYNGKDQGQYKITVYLSGSGTRFRVEGLESGDGLVDTAPQPIGSRGLYIQFSDRNVPGANTWTVSVPNTQSSTYITNYNAYQSALQTQLSTVTAAQNAVAAAQAALDLKKAQARPADVQAAEAQILSAQGQVQAAEASLENTIVRAPSDGTITSVNIKPGEQASPSQTVIVLQDVANLHIEANVSEANIAYVKSSQTVDVTFDALGPDRHFNATVQVVNPASTVVSGVVNYKVTAVVDDIEEIKPGMTANMTILVGQKDGVLAIPLRAVLSNGSKKVRVVDDAKKKSYHEVEIKTGMEADGGLVEVVSGLSEGQEIVTFIKQ